MTTTSSTSVSPSYEYSFTALISSPDDYLVMVGTYPSVYPYSSGRVTGYYAVSEPIAAFPELELPVPEVVFVASYLTII